MAVLRVVRLLVLSLITLGSFGRADDGDQGTNFELPPPTTNFTYPAVSNPAVPNLSNLTVYNDDIMIVEYENDAYTASVGLGMDCSDSFQDVSFNVSASTFPKWTYNSTGKLVWFFNATTTDSTSGVRYGNHFCHFVLWNASIDFCSWGAWGDMSLRLNWSSSRTSGYPIAYSPVFQFYPDNGTVNIWAGSLEAVELYITEPYTEPVTSWTTPVNVTCPLEGIPPAPTPVVQSQVDIFPPLPPGLQFPLCLDPEACTPVVLG